MSGQIETLKGFPVLFISVFLIEVSSAASVGANEKHVVTREEMTLNMLEKLAYSDYLREVINLLGAEEGRNRELEALKNLRNASPRIRNKLDELKRKEMQDIKELMAEIHSRGAEPKELHRKFKKYTRYIDAKYKHFSTEDLRKLLTQTNFDLALMDEQRRDKFKEYEMYKTLEYEELLSRFPEEEQKKIRENYKALQAHQSARPVVMPMSIKHLFQVWEERDHMNKENFNAKTFFHLHDLDGNGYLDEDETKVLFEDLVHKAYDPEAELYDPQEANEELERMREHLFKIIDANNDRMIDMKEFIDHTKRAGDNDHTFWQLLRAAPSVYTPEEFEEYKKKNQHLVKDMVDKGHITMNSSGFVEFHDLRKKPNTTEEHVESKEK